VSFALSSPRLAVSFSLTFSDTMLFQNPTFLGAVASTLLLSTSFVQGVCLHNHGRNLQAGPGSVPISNFSYIGVTGPLGWAGLNPANVKCSTANVQSPINIEHVVVPLSKTHPQLSIPNVKSAEFENLGSTVEVVINGTAIFEGKTYSLKQYHFHTPAEHLIDAQFYPMEVHFVNIASGKSLNSNHLFFN
jgi:carbonic anhydrase